MAIHSQMGSGRAEQVGMGPSVVKGHLTLSPVCNCGGGAPLIPWRAEACSLAGSQIHRWLRELLSLGMTQRNPGNSAKLHLCGSSASGFRRSIPGEVPAMIPFWMKSAIFSLLSQPSSGARNASDELHP